MTEVPAWKNPRELLLARGLHPKRAFSQNFLISKAVVERIAALAVPTPGTRVIELGPGAGTLTTELLRQGGEVFAIDQDRDMVRLVTEELAGIDGLHIEQGDAAAVDFSAIASHWPRFTVAGNLPYAITGQIFRRLTEAPDRVERAVLMIQKEVAERLQAGPGSKIYGALSVFVQAEFAAKLAFAVPPGNFFPAPSVTSAVVELTPIAAPPIRRTQIFRDVVKASFEQRRKTLRNSLQSAVGDRSEEICRAADIDPQARGETLTVLDFDRLASEAQKRQQAN